MSVTSLLFILYNSGKNFGKKNDGEQGTVIRCDRSTKGFSREKFRNDVCPANLTTVADTGERVRRTLACVRCALHAVLILLLRAVYNNTGVIIYGRRRESDE